MTKTFDTWLPLFSGFYNTILEPNYEYDSYCINEDRSEKGLPELDDAGDIQYDWSRYKEAVAENACDVVSDFLRDIGIRNKIEFEKVVSPREYNFRTDSVDIEIELNMMDLGRVIIKHYDEIEKEIEKRFTSRSGFISFISDKIWEWREDWNNNNFDEPRCIGALLEILLEINDYNYYNVNESIIDDLYSYEYITNWDELMKQSYWFGDWSEIEKNIKLRPEKYWNEELGVYVYEDGETTILADKDLNYIDDFDDFMGSAFPSFGDMVNYVKKLLRDRDFTSYNNLALF